MATKAKPLDAPPEGVEDDIRAAIAETTDDGADSDQTDDVGRDLRDAIEGRNDAATDAATDHDQAGAAGDAADAAADDGPGVAGSEESGTTGNGESAPDDSGESGDAEAAAELAAPEHWSAEDKERFAALPDDATRQTVLDWRKQIETGAREKFEQAAEARRFADDVGRLLQPYDHELAEAGATHLDAIRRLVNAERRLRQDPVGSLEWLAKDYGRQVAGTSQAHEFVRRIATAFGVDPRGAPEAETSQSPEAQRLAALEAREAERDRRARDMHERQQAQVLDTVEQEIRAFEEAKGEDGQPKHPHFAAVRATMGAMMQAAPGLTMDQAYERAVWADPTLREALTKAQAEQSAREADEARRSAVAKAKTAATPHTPSVNQRRADDDDVGDDSIATTLRKELTARETASRARI